jgi:dephospho-CoA kinase
MAAIMIGLVGTNGSGKSTICDYLVDRGFQRYSLSSVIHNYVREKGLPTTRDNLVETSNRLKAQKGQDVLAREMFQLAMKEASSKIVFDSIRNPDEVKFLKDHYVTLIGVDAPIEKRYERISARKRESDLIDFETFRQHDQRENSGESSGQNVFAAMKACENVITNDGSYDDLCEQVDQLLSVYI